MTRQRASPQCRHEGGEQPMRVKDEAPTAPRLRFTERMRGYFSTQVTRGFRAGWLRGRADGSSIDCTLTIDFEDLRETLEHPDRPARVSGTVDAPRLSPYELTVEDGEFILLERDDQRVETWHMRYRMRLLARDGRHYRLDGLKVLHDRPGFDAWWDTTTLYTTISDGGGSPLGVGIMRIRLADFLRQLRAPHLRRAARRGQPLPHPPVRARVRPDPAASAPGRACAAAPRCREPMV